jgi:hypothetical protein
MDGLGLELGEPLGVARAPLSPHGQRRLDNRSSRESETTGVENRPLPSAAGRSNAPSSSRAYSTAMLREAIAALR